MAKKIFLTAGHQVINGKGTGASSKFGDEAVEALRIRNSLTQVLRAKGLQVLNDVPSDTLTKVINWVKSIVAKDDVLIDIHFNAGPSQANGTEVFIPKEYTKTEVAFGTALAKAISTALGTKLRTGRMAYAGIKTEDESQHTRIGVLSGPTMATNALIEVCFITNEIDMSSYRNHYEKMINELARVIAAECGVGL